MSKNTEQLHESFTPKWRKLISPAVICLACLCVYIVLQTTPPPTFLSRFQAYVSETALNIILLPFMIAFGLVFIFRLAEVTVLHYRPYLIAKQQKGHQHILMCLSIASLLIGFINLFVFASGLFPVHSMLFGICAILSLPLQLALTFVLFDEAISGYNITALSRSVFICVCASLIVAATATMVYFIVAEKSITNDYNYSITMAE